MTNYKRSLKADQTRATTTPNDVESEVLVEALAYLNDDQELSAARFFLPPELGSAGSWQIASGLY